MVIGFAGGPLVAGPLSEVLGRRPVYAFCGLLYSAFSWGAAFAPNLATLLVCRFLMGVFGSASINNVGLRQLARHNWFGQLMWFIAAGSRIHWRLHNSSSTWPVHHRL